MSLDVGCIRRETRFASKDVGYDNALTLGDMREFIQATAGFPDGLVLALTRDSALARGMAYRVQVSMTEEIP